MRRHEKFDRHGGPVVDDDDVLREGQTVRVPMRFRDSMTELQRSVAEDAAARSSPVLDALGGTARLHQPGPRYARPAPEHRAARPGVRTAIQGALRSSSESPIVLYQHDGDIRRIRESHL